MMPSTIVIEVRNPRTKEERRVFGLTYAQKGRAHIFINARLNRKVSEFKDTVIHELYHAAVGIFKFSTKNEEKLAQALGKVLR